jgi:hypothetical protein
VSLDGLWAPPQFSELSLWQWAATVGVLTLAATLFSPHRRRAMGALKFIAAQVVSYSVPLAGVIVVRTAFRHAFVNEGRGSWESMWLSGLWMGGFILIGELLVTRLPPTSWLLRDLRRAGRDMWVGRFRRFVGRPAALERPI